MEAILLRSLKIAEQLHGYFTWIFRQFFKYFNFTSITSYTAFYTQYVTGRLFTLIAVPLLIVMVKLLRYRVRDLAAIRQTVRQLFKEHPGPWIICANHLTMIDSIILAWAMLPPYRYIFNYRLAPWNIPERNNFQKSFFVGLLCYLTKCIPITRQGKRKAVRSSLDRCSLALRKKENLMIFPEGGRSRTGRIDTENFQYGVGRLLNQIPDCRVMCFYLRGDNQNQYSNFPCFGETFSMKVSVCSPSSNLKGLKAHRDHARQIIVHLAKMEKDYFEPFGK